MEHISRRRLLIGSATAAVAGAAGYAAQDAVERWWWRASGRERPRTDGELDHPGAEWVAASSANWRRAERPADYTVDRIVVHVVQGSYGDALRVFRDPLHRAAAHYVVRADGHVAQTVRELDVAFHSGNRRFNERSVGIEHEGYVDRPGGFTDAMYTASARLAAGICARYAIPVDRAHIVAHSEVPGADHTDPGPHWDWDRYLGLVRAAAS
ncbi:N-acetylmuramoyl-L-alanine amidase [Streptomyces sp. ISL-11]|uniref:N-acetylmuramoyl-L-alanine amidase n=1 Tax=Streptomyces sp. ISL-11 TaxID=2819174 RepID=UPI001BE6AA55|nr:N-acetylmuramoyl-L-alanine amidase [Streptomyces sp. ISL-11]MBT2385372.1 N-acetylmuramoyl-L-alanine amidase [Streptomyces sp. ISL-11]